MIKLFRHARKSLIQENKMDKYFKYAIGEILLVVIGILIALQINNWNENRKINKSIHTTLIMLEDEIVSNKKDINRVKDYHIMVKNKIDSIEKPEKPQDIPKTISFWRGMQTPRLQNAAFQTTIQSGVSKEFNPEILKTLNKLYTFQDSYNEFTASSIQIFYNTDFTDINNFERVMTSISMTMNDLYYYERRLTELFENSLTTMDSLKTK